MRFIPFILIGCCALSALAESSASAERLPDMAEQSLAEATNLNTENTEILSKNQKDEVNSSFSTSRLFKDIQANIYQLQVINNATSQKTSIGSGFVIGDGKTLATNYHVIADAIHKENHSLQYLDHEEKMGKLTLLAVDVVNDLAIVQAKEVLGKPLPFASPPLQGDPLYAIGNPHDLGFVIVEGINNGLLRHSARASILFSGSLNSGMSGGPTVNQQGEVIGVNVSYLGGSNDISFVIPSEYLQALLKTAEQGKEINQAISEQLFADNEAYYRAALSQEWPNTIMSHYRVPLAMRNDVRCWDSSHQPEIDDVVSVVSISCFNDRTTFINDDTTIGKMGYAYTGIYAREPLLTSRFYRIYSKLYRMDFTRRSQRDYGDFDCRSQFITIADKPFKATLCEQPSKQFARDNEAIEDLRFIAAQIGESNQGFMIEISLDGVQQHLAHEILLHMLGQIQWQP